MDFLKYKKERNLYQFGVNILVSCGGHEYNRDWIGDQMMKNGIQEEGCDDIEQIYRYKRDERVDVKANGKKSISHPTSIDDGIKMCLYTYVFFY